MDTSNQYPAQKTSKNYCPGISITNSDNAVVLLTLIVVIMVILIVAIVLKATDSAFRSNILLFKAKISRHWVRPRNLFSFFKSNTSDLLSLLKFPINRPRTQQKLFVMLEGQCYTRAHAY